MLHVGFRADFRDPPIRKLAGQQQAESGSEGKARCLAPHGDSGRSAQVGNPGFAFLARKAFRDQGQAIRLLLAQADNFANQAALARPRFQHQASIPFAQVPLTGDEGKRFFTSIQHRGLGRPGDEGFNGVAEIGGSSHAE